MAAMALMLQELDAKNVAFTPIDATNWNQDADPGDVDDALDQLAARVDDLESLPQVAWPPGETDIVIVVAGQPCDKDAIYGTYQENGVNNEKPLYQKNGIQNIKWLGKGITWAISDMSMGRVLHSLDDVATPDLCTTWVWSSEPTPLVPVPSVTAQTVENPPKQGDVIAATGDGDVEWAYVPPFAFDTVEIQVGTQDGYNLPVTVTFKLNGVARTGSVGAIVFDTLQLSIDDIINMVGGKVYILYPGIWVIVLDAGDLSSVSFTAVVSSLPAAAILRALTPLGIMMPPVALNWAS